MRGFSTLTPCATRRRGRSRWCWCSACVPGAHPGSYASGAFAKVDATTVRYTIALRTLGSPKVLRWYAMSLEADGYSEVAPDNGALFVTRS